MMEKKEIQGADAAFKEILTVVLVALGAIFLVLSCLYLLEYTYGCSYTQNTNKPAVSHNCVCRIQCNLDAYILGGYKECLEVPYTKDAEKLAEHNCENSDRIGLCSEPWDPFCACICYAKNKPCE